MLEECTIQDYDDNNLKVWRTLVSTTEISKYNNTCTSKRTVNYNYIYCFPYSIKLRTGTQRMPPTVVRLDITEPFETPMQKYVPLHRRINITSQTEYPAIDSIHSEHFPLGSEVVDTTKWFDTIQKLRKLNEGLRVDKEAKVSVYKGGAMWWLLITLFIILTSTLAGLIGYNVYISDTNMKRQRVMARDIFELKSNYEKSKLIVQIAHHIINHIITTLLTKTQLSLVNKG